MKVALVHDYLKEYGGAERVLKVLTEIFPEALIYTAFRVKNSTAGKEFKDRKIIESWLAPLLKIWKLYSPLRFLIPLIWGSFNLSKYDLVINSASWYITKGFKVGSKTKVVCYCHTPPRWLYGYETSVGLTKHWPVKIYAALVGHFLRLHDWKVSQKINYWLANSINVQARIKKFYRKESTVIYPPVDVKKIIEKSQNSRKGDYFLIVSRLVGAKGIEKAIKAAKEYKFKLKIVGENHGYYKIDRVEPCQEVEFLGRVEDDELWKLYAGAKGFLALAKDEDFGMTVVEAQAAGTSVIAFNGGGLKESVIDGQTGILINATDEKTIFAAIKKLEKTNWDKKVLQANVLRFSKERFKKEMKNYIQKYAGIT